MRTEIFLCCLKLISQTNDLTAADFVQFASQFGKVRQIVIFSRKKIVKLFVEISEDDLCKNQLSILSFSECSFGKIQTFISKKKFIKPEKEIIGDYWSSESPSSLNNPKIPLKLDNNSNGFINSLKIKNLNNKPVSKKPIPNLCLWKNKIVQDFLSLLTSSENCSLDSKSIIYTLPHILKIKQFNFNLISVNMFANLFALWGNIKQVLISKQLKTAFIDFDFHFQAKTALNFLQGFPFYEFPLLISFVAKIKDKYLTGNQDYLTNISYWNRGHNNPLVVSLSNQSPIFTQFLTFSNVSCFVNVNSLRILVYQFISSGTVLIIHQLSKNKFLVCFPNIFESIKVLSQLQGFEVDNKRLQLLFVDYFCVKNVLSKKPKLLI